MKHLSLLDRKANLGPTQWHNYFSSILIQIKVVAEPLWVGSDSFTSLQKWEIIKLKKKIFSLTVRLL